MKRVSILYWHHLLGAIEGPAKLIGKGLAQNGCDVHFVNISEPDQTKLVEDIKSLILIPNQLIISITPLPLLLKIGDQELFEFLNGPIAILSVDAPVYLPENELRLFGKLPPGAIFLTIDAIYAKQMREYLHSRFPNKFTVIFFPFGGDLVVRPEQELSPDRDNDLVIFANLDWQISKELMLTDNFSGLFPDLKNTRLESKQKVVVEIAESLMAGSYNFELQGDLIKILDLEPLFENQEDIKFLGFKYEVQRGLATD